MVTNFANLPVIWGRTQPQPVARESNYSSKNQGSLNAILNDFGPFPPYSLVVGQCMDGLPFMLSLDNPRSGAILIVGENETQKKQILSTLSSSACRINHPTDVSWSLISSTPHQHAELVNSPHCRTITSPYGRAAGELIVDLASKVEQRRFGRERGGTHVVMIDDFGSFSPLLADYNVYLNFKSLITKGPACGIWPLVSSKPDEAYTEQGKILRSFGTYIFEKVGSEQGVNSFPRGEFHQPQIVQPNFNAIVGGRLIPISSVYV
jgi:hypothetical protein